VVILTNVGRVSVQGLADKLTHAALASLVPEPTPSPTPTPTPTPEASPAD